MSRHVGDGPLRVVERAAGDDEVAVLEFLEELDIGGDRRVEDLPFGAAVRERDGLNVLLGRMREDAADIGARVVGESLVSPVLRSIANRPAVLRLRLSSR